MKQDYYSMIAYGTINYLTCRHTITSKLEFQKEGVLYQLLVPWAWLWRIITTYLPTYVWMNAGGRRRP